MRRLFIRLLIAAPFLVLAFLLAIQLVPYGRGHTNPAVVAEPQWPSAESRALAERACFDCHSNETVWPAYASIAPMSWLVQRDVDEGREKLNFSAWGQAGGEGEEIEEMAEVVEEGEMPPRSYLLLHAEARLTAAEQAALVDALAALAGQRVSQREP
jgi:hypothetical protein